MNGFVQHICGHVFPIDGNGTLLKIAQDKPNKTIDLASLCPKCSEAYESKIASLRFEVFVDVASVGHFMPLVNTADASDNTHTFDEVVNIVKNSLLTECAVKVVPISYHWDDKIQSLCSDARDMGYTARDHFVKRILVGETPDGTFSDTEIAIAERIKHEG